MLAGLLRSAKAVLPRSRLPLLYRRSLLFNPVRRTYPPVLLQRTVASNHKEMDAARDDVKLESSGTKVPVWIDTASVPSGFPKLTENLATDVCVVGAGIAGLSAAYELAKMGKSVVLLEDGDIASGETGRTTAHLASGLDDHYFNLKSMHGLQGAKLAYESHAWAISRIEEVCKAENIDCEFRRLDGYLIHGCPRTSSEYNEKELKKEYEAATEVGINVEYNDGRHIPGMSIDQGAYVRFPNQGTFQPLKYVSRLSKLLAEKYGVKVFTHTHASKIEEGKVETSHGNVIRCRDVVLATNVPEVNRIAIIDKLEPFRTYAIAATIPKNAMSDCLIWDMADPYHYVRLTPSHDPNMDYLVVGGEDHKVGQADDMEQRYQRLEEWMRKRFNSVGKVDFRWSGQVLEPIDYLAYIGLNPGQHHTYICTGDSGNGMTHGVLAGKLLADLISGVHNPWADLYSPSRKPLKAAGTYIAHNARQQLEYARYLQRGDISDIEDLGRGCGAIIREGPAGVKPVAVYKDQNGQVFKMSAICPHLYGVVKWNADEKSFDCPVHGSRFDCKGRVLNGPAMNSLPPLNEPAEAATNDDRDHTNKSSM